MRERGALTSVVIAIACAALAAPALAVPRATVIGATGTQTLKVTAPKGKFTATLVLLVRNDSFHTAKPRAGFIPTAVSPKVRVETSATVLQAGGIEPVAVRLTAAEANALNGTVTIRLAGSRFAQEQAVPVAVGEPAAPPAVEPEEATLHQTRGCWFGEFICGDSSPPVVAVSSKSASVIGKSLSRFAGASDGGSATIKLAPTKRKTPSKLPPGLNAAEVTVEANSHGTYSTTFVLDPEAKQDGQLKVKVEVQVWWFWPLLVLLMGAFAGYLTRWLMGSYRDRNVLKARLIEQRDRYANRLETRSPGVYPLRAWFGEFADAIPKVPLAGEKDAEGQCAFVEAWFEIEQARSSTEVESASKLVEQLVSDVALWCKVSDALKSLDVAFRRNVPDPDVRASAIPAYRDTDALINRQRFPQPKSLSEAESEIEALAQQAQIVAAYERARVAWLAVPGDIDTYKNEDPKKIYGHAADVIHRKPEVAAQLVGKLEAAAEKLKRAPERHSTRELSTRPQMAIDRRTLLMSPELVLAEAAATGIAPISPQGALPAQEPDPSKIRRAISAIDWMVFLATLVVSAVLYLLTLYVGKNFGAPSQYVEAFAAGFGGQALVGVATMPLSASLRSVAKQAAG